MAEFQGLAGSTDLEVVAVAKYMLDGGCNIYSTNAGPGIVMTDIRKAKEPAGVLGHPGVSVIDETTTLTIPHIDKKANAIKEKLGVKDLTFRVEVVDGKVKLKARAQKAN